MAALLSLCCIVTNDAAENEEEQVWVCTGRSSQCYHKYKDCKGLETCNGNVRQISRKTAQTLDRRECKMCYKKQTQTQEDKNEKQEE